MNPSKKDIVIFVGITLLFIMGMVIMIVNHVQSWMAWTGFIIIWYYAEVYFAKNIHLKSWHWVLIILGLIILDLALISLIS